MDDDGSDDSSRDMDSSKDRGSNKDMEGKGKKGDGDDDGGMDNDDNRIERRVENPVLFLASGTASSTILKVGGQAVLGRQSAYATPWLTERHGYDPT